MFKQRVITAVALAAAFLAMLLNLSALAFSLVISLLVVIAGWEWSNLMKLSSAVGKAGYLLLLSLSMAAASHWLGLFERFDQARAQQMFQVAAALWAIIFLWIQGYPSSAILWAARPMLGLLGLLLLTFTWAAVASILHHESGQWLLLLAIAIIALADVGGYIAGNLLGKHKLAPIVSP